jgi:hypothetical protein
VGCQSCAHTLRRTAHPLLPPFRADIRRHHVEDFRTWLTSRSGYRTARLTPATLAHRLGTLRIFFVRITD